MLRIKINGPPRVCLERATKADIMAVKDLARHRSERTTLQNYAGVDKERSKAIHRDIMNDLLG